MSHLVENILGLRSVGAILLDSNSVEGTTYFLDGDYEGSIYREFTSPEEGRKGLRREMNLNSAAFVTHATLGAAYLSQAFSPENSMEMSIAHAAVGLLFLRASMIHLHHMRLRNVMLKKLREP